MHTTPVLLKPILNRTDELRGKMQGRCSPGGPSPWRIEIQHRCQENTYSQDAGTAMQAKLKFIWLELTSACNLNCVHCYADAGHVLPAQPVLQYFEWRKILLEAYSLGCEMVQFSGGEPTLSSDLDRLIASAHEMGYAFIEVFTNGTLLNDAFLDVCKDYRVNLAFSVYSNEPALHDAITRTSGSFVKTMSGIKMALDKKIPVRVGVIAVGDNDHTIDHTVKYLERLGVSTLTLDHVRGVGRGASCFQTKSVLNESCGTCLQDTLCVDSAGRIFPCIFTRSQIMGYAQDGLTHMLRGLNVREIRSELGSVATAGQVRTQILKQ